MVKKHVVESCKKVLCNTSMINEETIESKLLREVANIKGKITELELEKRTLERLIVRLRRESLSQTDVTRKSSSTRLLVENSVMQTLTRAKGKSVSVADLQRAAESVEFHLKPSTFRSHLRRMSEKGLIIPADYGRWKRAATEEEPL
jgi:DNA-binding transcriptional ArsR family regulator